MIISIQRIIAVQYAQRGDTNHSGLTIHPFTSHKIKEKCQFTDYVNFVYSESRSLYPSIFYHLSGVWLRGQQPKQCSPDFSLPNSFVQLFPVWLFSVRRRSRDSTTSTGTRQTVAQNTPFDEEGHCGGQTCKVRPGTVQRGNMGSPYRGLIACRRGRGHCVLGGSRRQNPILFQLKSPYVI